MEATTQFNTVSIGRSNLRVDDLVEGFFYGMLTVTSHRLPQL
jgi:hypothetical protein